MTKHRIIQTTKDLDTIRRTILQEGKNLKNFPFIQRPGLAMGGSTLEWAYAITAGDTHGSFSGLDEPDWSTALKWEVVATPSVSWRIDFYLNGANNGWELSCVIETYSTTSGVPNRILDAIEQQLR